mgnify:CR=1|jgi:hypothetical protein
MQSLLVRLNPRRWWLWHKYRNLIEVRALQRLPAPYGLGEIIIKARTGK